jgi:hypothetical protein
LFCNGRSNAQRLPFSKGQSGPNQESTFAVVKAQSLAAGMQNGDILSGGQKCARFRSLSIAKVNSVAKNVSMFMCNELVTLRQTLEFAGSDQHGSNIPNLNSVNASFQGKD